MFDIFELEVSWGLMSKLIAALVVMITLITPFIVAIIGTIWVRSTLKVKENAEAKKANAEADLAKEEINKIRQESRQAIREIIHEPTISDICEGYTKLLKSMRERVDKLEETLNNCQKRNEELESENTELRQQIDVVEVENDELREAIEGGN